MVISSINCGRTRFEPPIPSVGQPRKIYCAFWANKNGHFVEYKHVSSVVGVFFSLFSALSAPTSYYTYTHIFHDKLWAGLICEKWIVEISIAWAQDLFQDLMVEITWIHTFNLTLRKCKMVLCAFRYFSFERKKKCHSNWTGGLVCWWILMVDTSH